MKKLSFIFALLAMSMSACVGTDLIEETIVPERLRIISDVKKLDVGQTALLKTQFFNQYGIEETKAVTWKSSDASKITVDANGQIKALALGRTVVTATTNSSRDSLVINDGTGSDGGTTNPPASITERVGQFGRISQSYSISGTARLREAKDGKLTLIFDSNFQVSAGPSLYVLLTNHTNGGFTVTAGGNAKNGNSLQITANRLSKYTGEMTFDVPSGTKLTDYKFATLYCTLGPVFGAAELK